MKKIVSIILSIVILVASSGFTISSHICGGKRSGTVLRIANTNISCGMEKAEDACASSSSNQLNKSCCQNEFQTILMDEDYMKQKIEINFSFVFVAFFHDLLPQNLAQTIFYKDYSPPPLIRDIPILVESFLI
jgi:uncharacterized protein YxeA